MNLHGVILCMALVLLLCAGGALSNCRNRVDIVIAVDTTSSMTDTSFEDVKAQVKEIVSGFTIDQKHTRLALISITSRANVIVIDGVNSVADFNAAVDNRLTFSTETAVVSEGIRVAKDSVLVNARTVKTLTALILVKDRRVQRATDSAELSRMASKAARVKSAGTAIHAIGVGGLWTRLELESLFGTEYLLFKNKNALQSTKSLNNHVCEADCPRKGAMDRKEGLCYDSSKHVLSSNVGLATNSAGLSVCRTEIDRSFETCPERQACTHQSRDVGSCGTDKKVTIKSEWQMFDRRAQACATLSSSHTVDCADAWKCDGQVADVMFCLDMSVTVARRNFEQVKRATIMLAESLNIGPDNVRAGVLTFSTRTNYAIQLGYFTDRNAFLRQLGYLDVSSPGLRTTFYGLSDVRLLFGAYGRKDVAKFVIVITDGLSTEPESTKQEADKLKRDGVTIIAIGVAEANVAELSMLTAPETATNMFILRDFEQLKAWSKEFSKKLCLRLTAPNPKLCDDAVIFPSVSECVDGKQRVTKTEFKYSDADRCIKTVQTTEHATCKRICSSPTDGNTYVEGDTWTSLCHEFTCTSSKQSPFQPMKSRCQAADGACVDTGSAPFRCLNDLGVETDNCQCVEKHGRAVVLIDKE